jgi:hypothetical protein
MYADTVRIERVTKRSYQIAYYLRGEFVRAQAGGNNSTVAKAIAQYEHPSGRLKWERIPDTEDNWEAPLVSAAAWTN